MVPVQDSSFLKAPCFLPTVEQERVGTDLAVQKLWISERREGIVRKDRPQALCDLLVGFRHAPLKCHEHHSDKGPPGHPKMMREGATFRTGATTCMAARKSGQKSADEFWSKVLSAPKVKRILERRGFSAEAFRKDYEADTSRGPRSPKKPTRTEIDAVEAFQESGDFEAMKSALGTVKTIRRRSAERATS